MKRGTLFNHPQKEMTTIGRNLIRIMAPYGFPMGSRSGIGGSSLLMLIIDIGPTLM
jgi:hypothetical protein